jgi:hypothetical protein
MTVRSQELVDGQIAKGKAQEHKEEPPPPERVQTISSPRIAAGLMLITFGLPLWLGGAQYTFDGWPIGLNYALAWLHLPASIRIPIPPLPDRLWYVRLISMIVLGLIYSRIETRPPVERLRRKRVAVFLLLWFIFIIAIVTDAGSTFFGVQNPAPDAWDITKWIASNLYPAIAWAVFLTFVPDWMLIVGWRLLFARRG